MSQRKGVFLLRARAMFAHGVHAIALGLGAAVLSFILFQVLPGDVARAILGLNASEQQVAALRSDLGYDAPICLRALRYVGNLARFDLGRSACEGRRVAPLVGEKFAITATIGLQAAFLSLLISYGLNLLVFLEPRSAPFLEVTRFGVLLPVFLVTVLTALLIGLFFPQISLSKGGAAVGPFTQIVPTLIASLYPSAVMTTVLRERITDVMRQPAFRAAESYGTTPFELFHRNLFRPSSAPWFTAWINQLGLVFFGSLVIEVILSIPGSGNLLLSAIQNRDFPILQGIIMFNAAFFIASSWLGECFLLILDPRIT